MTRQLWRAPLLLAIGVGVGLACALLGDGPGWQALGWGGLGAPLAAIAYHVARGHR